MQNTGLHISTSSLKGSVHILCRKPWKEGRGRERKGRERKGRKGREREGKGKEGGDGR